MQREEKIIKLYWMNDECLECPFMSFWRIEYYRWKSSQNSIGWHNILMYQDFISISSIAPAFLSIQAHKYAFT